MTDNNSAPELRFAEWFRKNYPGPDTIIGDPDWHAPKIFQAAIHAARKPADLCAADRGVTVKPLVWHDCTDGTSHDDDCQYEVEQDGKMWRVIRASTGPTSYLCHAKDREAAKAAAQSDYERRILAALQPVAVMEADALQSAIDLIANDVWEPNDFEVNADGKDKPGPKAIAMVLNAAANGQLSIASPTPATDNTALVAAAKELLAGMVETYRARNNRQVSIQADDGEKCWIVHSDLTHALQCALDAALANREAPPEAKVTVAGLTRAIPAEGDTIDRMRANLWVTPEGRTLMNSGDVRLYWLIEGDVNTAALRALGGSN